MNAPILIKIAILISMPIKIPASSRLLALTDGTINFAEQVNLDITGLN
jgi:hypothetical protein